MIKQDEAEAVLDAAGKYMKDQYGIDILLNPIDRERILKSLLLVSTTPNDGWPPNPWHCAHKNSCMRNRQCMYVGCVHNDRLCAPLNGEVL